MKTDEDELFYKSLIYDKLHINEGMFMENYVAQVLRTKGYRELFFYEKRDEKTYQTKMEIDFLRIHDRKISPVEVKSASGYSLTSLKKFKEAFKGKVGEGIVLHDGDYKEEDGISFFPLFTSDWVL